MTSYSESLQDPRWQKKRLEVLEREKWTCEICKRTDKTLHVHHIVYHKGKKPWEYHHCFLRCLCKDCHANVENLREAVMLAIGCLPSPQVIQVLGYARGLLLADGVFADMIVSDDAEAIGVAAALCIPEEEVRKAIRLGDGKVTMGDFYPPDDAQEGV